MVSEACDSAFGETETVHLFLKKKEGLVQEQVIPVTLPPGYLAIPQSHLTAFPPWIPSGRM